jgi:hypothetical protein
MTVWIRCNGFVLGSTSGGAMGQVRHAAIKTLAACVMQCHACEVRTVVGFVGVQHLYYYTWPSTPGWENAPYATGRPCRTTTPPYRVIVDTGDAVRVQHRTLRSSENYPNISYYFGFLKVLAYIRSFILPRTPPNAVFCTCNF